MRPTGRNVIYGSVTGPTGSPIVPSSPTPRQITFLNHTTTNYRGAYLREITVFLHLDGICQSATLFLIYYIPIRMFPEFDPIVSSFPAVHLHTVRWTRLVGPGFLARENQ